jgi:hypothetical protein
MPIGQKLAGCQGTATAPEAAPGYLCLYERAAPSDVLARSEKSTRWGFIVGASGTASTAFAVEGTWAVTAP